MTGFLNLSHRMISGWCEDNLVGSRIGGNNNLSYMRIIWGCNIWGYTMKMLWGRNEKPGLCLVVGCIALPTPSAFDQARLGPLFFWQIIKFLTLQFPFSQDWIIMIWTSLTANALSSIPCLMKASRSFFTCKDDLIRRVKLLVILQKIGNRMSKI